MPKKELNRGGIKMNQLTELMDEIACSLSDLNVLIKEKYIEKKKVKDAIDKLTKFEYGADSLYEKALMDLLKELGLE